jgi:hypothetical protein
MKTVLLILSTAALVTGCHTRREVVYDTPRTTTVVREPAGTVRVYEPRYRTYQPRYRVYETERVYRTYPRYQPKAAEYHQQWVR